MEPVVSGSSAVYDTLQVFWWELRHVLEVALWALVAGLAGAAGCWCCGYAVRTAWIRTGPPARRPRRAAGDPAEGEPDVVDLARLEEAERGIGEIEAYLASVCAARPDSSPSDRGERHEPGAESPPAG